MPSDLRQRLDRARRELLDLSTRNRLLSIPVASQSARVTHIADELSPEVFRLLVTDRKTSQIEVEINDSSPLLGRREGHLIGSVTLYYGIDVQALDSSCLSHVGNRLIVRLPEPRELDFAMDPGSFRYVTKRSGWNVVRDFVLNQNLETELRQQVHRQALTFFKEKQLIPTRAKIVNQLNNLAAAFSKEIGVPVEFQ